MNAWGKLRRMRRDMPTHKLSDTHIHKRTDARRRTQIESCTATTSTRHIASTAYLLQGTTTKKKKRQLERLPTLRVAELNAAETHRQTNKQTRSHLSRVATENKTKADEREIKRKVISQKSGRKSDSNVLRCFGTLMEAVHGVVHRSRRSFQ